MPPKDALSGAVQARQRPEASRSSFIDPDGVWKKEWGELYRVDDEGEVEGEEKAE